MKDNNITVCLTGGHLAPALAVAEECKKRADVRTIFIGREKVFEKEQNRSVECDAVRPYAHGVYAIPAGRSLKAFSTSFFQALKILQKEHPSIIVSFGGYVAFPIVLAGLLCRIPIVTHEQTRKIGNANKWISLFSKAAYVSYPDKVGTFPFGKGTFVGPLIRQQLFTPDKDTTLSAPKNKPVIYFAGGTSGSVTLNQLVFSILPKVVPDFVVFHQTGDLSVDEAVKKRAELPVAIRDQYLPQSYFSTSEIAAIFQQVSFFVGRSGANTVGELAVLAIPAILIPLPSAAQSEQLHNAEWLDGTVEILHQDTLSSDLLLNAIHKMQDNIAQYRNKARDFSSHIPRNGAEQFVEKFLSLIS